MSLPAKVHTALVEERNLPSNYDDRLKRFAYDFGLGVREGLCAREISLNHWRRQQAQNGEYQESVAFRMFASPEDRFAVNRDTPLFASESVFLSSFNEKWKQGSFTHDDDLIANLCLTGLFCDSRGGARLGAGTYALTERGLRQSDTALRKLLYHIAGEDLSPSTWVRVLAFFVISEFVIVRNLEPHFDKIRIAVEEFINILGF